MGIPYYFYSLTQKYNTIISNTKPVSLDLYCIDFNGIIHNVAQDIIKKYNGTDKAKHNNDIIEQEIIEGYGSVLNIILKITKRPNILFVQMALLRLRRCFSKESVDI
jgi:5'-3' exonuclease